jgi:hypothetical protein
VGKHRCKKRPVLADLVAGKTRRSHELTGREVVVGELVGEQSDEHSGNPVAGEAAAGFESMLA